MSTNFHFVTSMLLTVSAFPGVSSLTQQLGSTSYAANSGTSTGKLLLASAIFSCHTQHQIIWTFRLEILSPLLESSKDYINSKIYQIAPRNPEYSSTRPHRSRLRNHPLRRSMAGSEAIWNLSRINHQHP